MNLTTFSKILLASVPDVAAITGQGIVRVYDAASLAGMQSTDIAFYEIRFRTFSPLRSGCEHSN